jgi:hypothetical protein
MQLRSVVAAQRPDHRGCRSVQLPTASTINVSAPEFTTIPRTVSARSPAAKAAAGDLAD